MTRPDRVSRWVRKTARELARNNPSPTSIRERDLSNALKKTIEAEYPGCAKTFVLDVADWPTLGRSTTDVVLTEGPKSRTPRAVFELKWCQADQDKVHEAVWDLFKVALLTRQHGIPGYLVTGAPSVAWDTALCADLFDSSVVSSADLLKRRFKNDRPIWDWLLEGGYGRYPDRVPDRIKIRQAGRAVVGSARSQWEVRAVGVAPAAEARNLALKNGWPRGKRPSRTTYPRAG